MTDLDKEQLRQVAGGGIPFWGSCHFFPWNKNDLCYDATPFYDRRLPPPYGVPAPAWRLKADALWKKAFFKPGTYRTY
jgi:hypothetical protein